MAGRIPTIIVLAAATAGLLFASVSTFDFVQHLDRQIHDLHCSFAPGLVAGDEGTDSGCHVALMSPYSSALRSLVWGGLPISLPGMAVFAFLLFRGVDLLGRGEHGRRASASVLLGATIVPLLTSIVMGLIAVLELGAACKLCIGIYGASALAFGAALAAWIAIRREPRPERDVRSPGALLQGLVQLGVFVVVPSAVYLVLVPDFSRYIGKCGVLPKPADPYGVMVPIGGTKRGIPAIEVFDPLCPACSGFEHRLEASRLADELRIMALLFPLDEECNWMVKSSLHPGACVVSEAMLCAAEDSPEASRAVLDWAYEHQEDLLDMGRTDAGALAERVRTRFPELDSCIGSAPVRARLNRSLRWTVANRLPVLTPQLYIDGVKLCDEDIDLGMDYALARMIELYDQGKLGGES
jgi:hypothetical protein